MTVPEVAGAFDRIIARAEANPAYACSLYLELPVLVIAEAGGEQEVAVKRVRLTPRSETAGTELAGAYVTNSNPVPLAIRLVEEEGLPCGDGVPVVVPCFDDSACDGTGCGPDGYCAAAFPAGTRRPVCAPGPGGGRPAVQPVRARRDVHPVLRVARLAVLRDRRQIPRVQRRRERDG